MFRITLPRSRIFELTQLSPCFASARLGRLTTCLCPPEMSQGSSTSTKYARHVVSQGVGLHFDQGFLARRLQVSPRAVAIRIPLLCPAARRRPGASRLRSLVLSHGFRTGVLGGVLWRLDPLCCRFESHVDFAETSVRSTTSSSGLSHVRAVAALTPSCSGTRIAIGVSTRRSGRTRCRSNGRTCCGSCLRCGVHTSSVSCSAPPQASRGDSRYTHPLVIPPALIASIINGAAWRRGRRKVLEHWPVREWLHLVVLDRLGKPVGYVRRHALGRCLFRRLTPDSQSISRSWKARAESGEHDSQAAELRRASIRHRRASSDLGQPLGHSAVTHPELTSSAHSPSAYEAPVLDQIGTSRRLLLRKLWLRQAQSTRSIGTLGFRAARVSTRLLRVCVAAHGHREPVRVLGPSVSFSLRPLDGFHVFTILLQAPPQPLQLAPLPRQRQAFCC